MTTNEPSVAALSLTGIWGASVLGLQFGTIAIVTGFVILGSFGRLGFEIAQQAEQPAGIKWSKIAALFGSSLTSAATIAVVVLAGLKAAGIQNDSATLFGAVFCGFIGAKSLSWLFRTASTIFTKRTGIVLPTIDGTPPLPKEGTP